MASNNKNLLLAVAAGAVVGFVLWRKRTPTAEPEKEPTQSEPKEEPKQPSPGPTKKSVPVIPSLPLSPEKQPQDPKETTPRVTVSAASPTEDRHDRKQSRSRSPVVVPPVALRAETSARGVHEWPELGLAATIPKGDWQIEEETLDYPSAIIRLSPANFAASSTWEVVQVSIVCEDLFYEDGWGLEEYVQQGRDAAADLGQTNIKDKMETNGVFRHNSQYRREAEGNTVMVQAFTAVKNNIAYVAQLVGTEELFKQFKPLFLRLIRSVEITDLGMTLEPQGFLTVTDVTSANTFRVPAHWSVCATTDDDDEEIVAKFQTTATEIEDRNEIVLTTSRAMVAAQKKRPTEETLDGLKLWGQTAACHGKWFIKSEKPTDKLIPVIRSIMSRKDGNVERLRVTLPELGMSFKGFESARLQSHRFGQICASYSFEETDATFTCTWVQEERSLQEWADHLENELQGPGNIIHATEFKKVGGADCVQVAASTKSVDDDALVMSHNTIFVHKGRTILMQFEVEEPVFPECEAVLRELLASIELM